MKFPPFSFPLLNFSLLYPHFSVFPQAAPAIVFCLAYTPVLNTLDLREFLFTNLLEYTNQLKKPITLVHARQFCI